MTYRVTIKGQFEYTTDVDGDSPEDAKDWAMVDLENATDDVRFIIINSMEVTALQEGPGAKQKELPQANDLEDIDFTNGVDPTEYIRKLRE